MAITAKHATFATAVFAGFTVLFIGTVPVQAHAGHHHGPATSVSGHAQVGERIDVPSQVEVQAPQAADVGPTEQPNSNAAVQEAPAQPAQPCEHADCCCGSVACHAGLIAQLLTITYPLGSRFEFPHMSVPAGVTRSGIDRPPRAAA